MTPRALPLETPHPVELHDGQLVICGTGKTELDQQATKLLAGPATVSDGPAPGVSFFPPVDADANRNVGKHELRALTAWDERLALGEMSAEDYVAAVRGLMLRKERLE